jgi:nitroreductase
MLEQPLTADAGATGLDLTTVDALLTTTRAVRKRLDLTRPVPTELILECLRLAIQAPTGSNTQGWRWIVVTDPEARTALARLYQNPPEAGAPPNPADLPPQQRRVIDSAQYLTAHMHEVPAMVVPCTAEGGGAAGWAPSIYPAVWSLMLALRSRGLGSCMTTVHLFRKEEAAELLGVPTGFVQTCLIPVAYYTGNTFKPAIRLPVEDVTFINHWGHHPSPLPN